MLCALLLAPAANAQVADAPAGLGDNAALQYWPAFTRMPQTSAELKVIEDWKDAPLNDATAKLLDGSSLGYLHAGAQKRWCNWGGDVSQGPYLLLRHLNHMRNLSRFACLAVRYDLSKKRWAAAVDHVADDIAAARHTAQEPIAISRLVGWACEREATDTIAAGLNKLDAEALARLSSRLDAMPPTATEAEALQNEARMTTGWAIGKVKAAGSSPDWHRVLEFLDVNEGPKDPAASIDAVVKNSGGTPEGVVRQLEALLPYYDEAAKLVMKPLSQAEFTRKANELRQRFDANPFAKAILPNLPAIHDSHFAAQTRELMLKAAIALVQRGPDAVKELRDPVNHQPITYEKRGNGFVLSSTVTYRNEPVRLTVGSEK